jgi:hypothetical protein
MKGKRLARPRIKNVRGGSPSFAQSTCREPTRRALMHQGLALLRLPGSVPGRAPVASVIPMSRRQAVPWIFHLTLLWLTRIDSRIPPPLTRDHNVRAPIDSRSATTRLAIGSASSS